MIFDSNSLEVQQILSNILKCPADDIKAKIPSLFPNKPINEQIEILSGVQRSLENILDTSLQSGGPTLTHRLRFSWLILKKADNLIRRNGKKLISENPPPYDLKYLFKGVLNSEELYDCFSQEISNKLFIGGGFVRYYYDFLISPKPKLLKMQFLDGSGVSNTDNVRRIIWWIIRRNKYQYIEFNVDDIHIHFTSLSDDVSNALPKWCGPEINSILNASEEIENAINSWLSYSCLEGERCPSNKAEQQEIVRYFVKDNELKHKIKEIFPLGIQNNKERDEYEKLISRFAEENKKLERDRDSLQCEVAELKKEIELLLRGKGASESTPVIKSLDLEEQNSKLKAQLAAFQDQLSAVSIPSQSDSEADFLGKLQDFLKTIDSKYSFDILRSVQLGDTHSITFKNFIDHFFYCMRKIGFSAYPMEEQFELDYNRSGLYHCIDFQIPPGGKILVKVEKRGWALMKGERFFPIRKAVLRVP